ncbi:hypothetical protein L211DRAFT_771959, partial [Terfezia boudieri ATCC MYA-4762]
LSRLPNAEGAAYNHRLWEYEDRCLPDTRVDLRQQIMNWFENPKGECIFWLNGMAGTGKSTISRTVAWDLAEKKRLAASFFFSRGRGDISHAGQFFTTIAAQLARSLPALRPLISKAIEENFEIENQVFSEQWKHLILNPLKNAPAQSIQLVVVIDALDECDNKDDIQLILKLLAQAKCLETIRLRVFVTSRPETPILLGFRNLPGEAYQDFVLHNIPLSTVNQDISAYFRKKLSLVKSEPGLSSTPWPDEPTIQRLVEKAAGLFIYAATIYRFIRDDYNSPEEQLSVILEEDHDIHPQSPTKHLDEMYTKLLQYSLIGNQDGHVADGLTRRFRRIVGSIIIMFDVMPAKEIAKLLRLPTISKTLASLRSVLNVPEEDLDRILRFLEQDFLHWLEALSLIREVSNGVLMVRALDETLRGKLGVCQKLLEFAYDAKRFILHNRSIIGIAPLQVYYAALLFTPETSLLRRQYLRRIPWIHREPKVIRNWSPLIQTFEGHSHYVNAVVFSPDGKLVASASHAHDSTVRLWDTATGESCGVLEGHSHWVEAVVFSPDGKLVASASLDKTVRLWDTAT